MSVKSEACYRFMRKAYRGLCVRPVVEGGYCPRLKVGIAAGGRRDFKAFSLDTAVPSGFKFSSEI